MQTNVFGIYIYIYYFPFYTLKEYKRVFFPFQIFFSVTSSPTNQLHFFFQEQSVLSLLDMLQGLHRESKDCEKDHYKS